MAAKTKSTIIPADSAIVAPMGNPINAAPTPSTSNATSHRPQTHRAFRAAPMNTWREALQQLEDTRNAVLSRFSFDNVTMTTPW